MFPWTRDGLPLQNIPIRTGLGREIRDALRPEVPRALIDFDYAEAERRIAEQMAQPKGPLTGDDR